MSQSSFFKENGIKTTINPVSQPVFKEILSGCSDDFLLFSSCNCIGSVAELIGSSCLDLDEYKASG